MILKNQKPTVSGSGNNTPHNSIKQCSFVHVGYENLTMGCPNLVQIQTWSEAPCTKLRPLLKENQRLVVDEPMEFEE